MFRSYNFIISLKGRILYNISSPQGIIAAKDHQCTPCSNNSSKAAQCCILHALYLENACVVWAEIWYSQSGRRNMARGRFPENASRSLRRYHGNHITQQKVGKNMAFPWKPHFPSTNLYESLREIRRCQLRPTPKILWRSVNWFLSYSEKGYPCDAKWSEKVGENMTFPWKPNFPSSNLYETLRRKGTCKLRHTAKIWWQSVD